MFVQLSDVGIELSLYSVISGAPLNTQTHSISSAARVAMVKTVSEMMVLRLVRICVKTNNF